MNKPKVTEYDYIDFLIGTQKVYSCPEAERVHPDETNGPSHDAFTRQSHRLFPTVDRLWTEVEEHVDLNKGYLIADDSTLADLYDPLTMPAELTKAHTKLDKAVDKCYRPKAFSNELNRMQFLFSLYEELT